jgi:hypothetical protein
VIYLSKQPGIRIMFLGRDHHRKARFVEGPAGRYESPTNRHIIHHVCIQTVISVTWS